jgi:hypothetical protein
MKRMRRPPALVFAVALAATFACKRTQPETQPVEAPAPAITPPAPDPVPGVVGPLGTDCFDTKNAKVCPPDPSDPSGHKLPAHGGACKFHICQPCGSEKTLAFRDDRGVPSAGYCICVPTSDSSGRGTLTCYSKEAWKRRSQ